ncbi:unnamed protein product [Cylindrotheca closterium]|uniref:Uncharacterized protein n=1 Tax=Cylindrotheca closterium TaxID=2856 RepID=A0AAD2CNZ7_9STRA|nr:unnamed protein product [Cylindrotheca closterium]
MRYFMKHDDNPGGKTLLYFAHVSANGNSGKIDTAIIEKNGEFQNEDLRETVISWARSLGRALYGKERGAEETLDRDKDDFESLIDYAIKKCRNPGFRFLYNFANSEPLDESVRSKIEAPSPRVSNLLACFAAHNILQQIDSNAGKKSGSRNVSILQRAVGGLLHAFNCSKKLIDLLSQFLISASMSYLHKQASKTHVKYLEGIRLPNLWDMIVYCNDNKDFLKNKDEKMDNWVVQTVKHVDKDDPVLAPCYEGKLCTVKKNLDCILDDCEDEGKDPYAAGIFGIRDIDYQRLTFYKLGHMEYCISHPFCHVKDLCPLIRQDNPNLKRKVPPLRNLGIDVRAHCQRSKTEQGCDL